MEQTKGLRDLRLVRSRGIKCCICILEETRGMMIREEISAEAFIEFQERIQYLIMSSSNRRRLACGSKHYEELLETVEGIKAIQKEKKCWNVRCKHTKSKHFLGAGSCDAARCKCQAFLLENGRQENAEIALQDKSPQVQEWAMECRKRNPVNPVQDESKENGGNNE